jgi:hypothetical protein
MTPLSRATDAAARVLGVPSTFMSGYSRAPRVVAGRDAVWAALRDRGVSYYAIARLCGRAEQTVAHGVKVARARAAHDPAYAEAIRAIAEEVKA